MRSRIALLSLLFASTLQAQIILGPESFVCQPRFSGTEVGAAAVATNGHETLAIVQSVGNSLYLQRLGDDAQPLTEHGVVIVRNAYLLGGIASNGNGYVLLWTTNWFVWSMHIGAGGEISEPQAIAATANNLIWPRIVSNGSGYLAAWTDITASTQQAMAVRLDGDGNPIGKPFPLSARRNEAELSALASDGRDYLAAVERFDGINVQTTLVPVSGAGAVGTSSDLPFYLGALVHTASGYVGLWPENGTKAAAIDPSGQLGTPATISTAGFMAASSNGSDVVAIGYTFYYPNKATRIRRNGNAIEVVASTMLWTQTFSQIVAAAIHTGDFITISLRGPAGVARIAAPERPLLTFPVRQDSPVISGNVVAWREGTLIRAARAGVDAAGLDIADFAAAVENSGPYPLQTPYVVANDARHTLIAWSELRRVGEAGVPAPTALKGRMLAADGTLSPPFAIADTGFDGNDRILLGAATATSNGFAVVWQQTLGSHIAIVDANGNVARSTNVEIAINPAAARRSDGVLLLYDDQYGTLAAAPFRADLTAAGTRQTLAANADARDLATDGNGHFLAVFTKDNRLWSQALDENGVPAGAAQLLGDGFSAHVAWNGSIFAVVSDAKIALVTADGHVLAPLSKELPGAMQTVISSDTIATVHSAIDTGLGDENVVFVRRFSLAPPRHRATRP